MIESKIPWVLFATPCLSQRFTQATPQKGKGYTVTLTQAKALAEASSSVAAKTCSPLKPRAQGFSRISRPAVHTGCVAIQTALPYFGFVKKWAFLKFRCLKVMYKLISASLTGLAGEVARWEMQFDPVPPWFHRGSTQGTGTFSPLWRLRSTWGNALLNLLSFRREIGGRTGPGWNAIPEV